MMGLQDRPTVPPPPDMTVEGAYINARIGDLREDLNDEFKKLYTAMEHERTDTRQLVNSVLEQYQKLLPGIERKIAKLKAAFEDELDIEIIFDNGGI